MKILKLTKFNFVTKTIFIVLTSIIIPLLCTLTISTIIYHNIVINHYKDVSKQQVDFQKQYLNTVFNNINDQLTLFLAQENFFQKSEVLEINDSIYEKKLVDLCFNNPLFSNAYILNFQNQTLFSAYKENKTTPDFNTIISSEWFSRIEKSYPTFLTVYPFGNSTSLSFVRTVRNPDTFEFLGYCMVKLNLSILRSSLQLTQYDIGSISIITDEFETLISQGKPKFDNKKLDLLLLNTWQKKNSQIFYCATIPHSNLYIIADFSEKFSQTLFFRPVFLGILLSIICIIISIYIAIYQLHQLLDPLHNLADKIATTDPSHLEIFPIQNRSDEVGMLIQQYNDLIIRINEMIDVNYKAILNMQEAQLNALQFQINPHFVNNTLQLIGEIAIEHEVFEVYDLISSFSRMFYYSLKYKGTTVSLKDELNYMQNYIKIQQARYPNKFVYQVDIDPLTSAFQIPKMSIQPIIENCFSHAFTHMKTGCSIHITSKMCDKHYEVSIIDNGCGIASDTLKKIISTINNTNYTTLNNESHIGLRNVNARIKFLYGLKYGLIIHTQKCSGTQVILSLPTKLEEEDKHD